MKLSIIRLATWRYLLCVVLLCLVSVYLVKVSYSIIHWKAYIWLPSYLTASLEVRPDARPEHLIFVMVDHYEPGSGDAGVKLHEKWTKAFLPIASGHHDSYGNRFKYNWFYPYDQKNDRVLASLASLAYEGLGEIELHWHHPHANNETFERMLESALPWFHQYGALISSAKDQAAQFAFIHGNWRLDNSMPQCGVTRELDILRKHGCYADLTFSTIGTNSQPSKVNAIYYALDSDGSKSYDTGIDVAVGRKQSDALMMIEGPIKIEWNGHINYGAVESYALPTARAIDQWIDANVHVRGRPEWVFVKVYTHGCQSLDIVEDGHLDSMLSDLSAACDHRRVKVHYMTARECYNVIRAAEDGRSGDPEEFRDYLLPKPRNLVIRPPAAPANGR
jgi:hypothetical protein